MNAPLAVLGAAPAFSEKLHVGRPNVGDAERFFDRAREIFARRWFSNNGECVREFEERLKRLTGAKHCIPMCNATVALEIAIRALELKGEVIVPSFTFIATAHALQWQEITPVFCDVDPRTHNLDPAKIERLLTPRTSGIIGVHIWGRPCAVDELQVLAKARGLRLMFDAAHALGCSHGGRMIGNFGECEVFSFHATKFLNSFEGGAVATNDDALADKIRLMKNFGFAGMDNVIYIGTNGKMNELSAAMGITGLESMEHFIAVNRGHQESYARGLAGLPGLEITRYDERERCNFQYVIIEIDEAGFGISRDELLRVLHAENVLARRYFFPGTHRQQPYRSLFPNAGLLLSETERLCSRVLSLPNGTGVTTADVERVCEVICAAHANAPSVRKALAAAT